MSSEASNPAPPADEVSYRRQTYLVKSDLQARYAIMFILITLIGVAVGAITVALSPLVWNPVPLFPLTYFLVVFVLFMGIAVASVLFTNRVAGPAYRLEKTLGQALTARDLDQKVKLREGDELTELADHVNALFAALRASAHADRARAARASAALDEALAALRAKGEDELAARLEAAIADLGAVGRDFAAGAPPENS